MRARTRRTAVPLAATAVALGTVLAATAGPADAAPPRPASPAATRPAPAAHAVARPAAPLSGLHGQLDSILGDLPHSVTVQVAGAGVLRMNATALMPPASTEKLYTTGTALLTLGPSYRFVTTIYGTGPIDSRGVLHGNLILRGAGDANFSGHDINVLDAALKARGLRRVAGTLVVDASRYAEDTVAPGWKADYVPWETGPVSAFSVDRNAWRTDPVYVANPTAGNLARWRQMLNASGIAVSGGNAVFHTPSVPRGSTPLASHVSAPLSVTVGNLLRVSDNYQAEMLLHEVGAAATGRGSRASGVATVRATAHRLGVPFDYAHDGSGLSRADLTSSGTEVAWLTAVDGTGVGSLLRASLPVSCRSGTLARRLCALPGAVQAKTGTLSGVHALAGHTRTRNGREVVFSILTMGGTPSTALSRIDAAVAAIAAYTG